MSKSKYLDDKSVEDNRKDNGLISPKDIIIGSAILAGSVTAFKTGALKPLIKEAIELTGNTKPSLAVGFNDLRKWLKSDEGVSSNSLFRKDFKSIVTDVVKGNKDSNVAKEIIQATKDDWKLFEKRFSLSMDALEKSADRIDIINNYANTDILNQIKRGSAEVSKYSNKYKQQKATMKSKIFDKILSNFTVTDKQQLKQLKRTGYRTATFDDLVEQTIDEQGFIRLKAKDKYKFSKGKDDAKDPLKVMEDMLNFHVAKDNGERLYRNGEVLRFKDKYNLKNLILDKDILIDEAGNLADLRQAKRSTVETIRNLSNEWKIPFININPLQLLGLGKIGRQKVKFATIKEDMVSPVLTGKFGNKVENTIGNVKGDHDKLKDVVEGVTIIDGDVYTLDKNKGIKKLNYKYKKDIEVIPKSMADNTSSLDRRTQAQLRMMGISKKKFQDYTEDDGRNFIYQKIAKFFDIGRQEMDAAKGSIENIAEATNPDSFIESAIAKATSKFRAHKGAEEYANFTEMMRPGAKSAKEDTFLITNRAISLKDLKINGFNKEIVGDYFKQFFADFRKDSELVNKNTGVLHFIVDRMNQTISSVGLGASLDSSSSAFASVATLVGKRFLPIYATYQGWNALNALTEGEDENGQRTNLNRAVMEGVAAFDIGASKIRDALGITDFSKKVAKLMPGFDQIEELPGITLLNLHQSAEERQDYWEYGKDPVRKGRFWSLNSSNSFTGGKVSYFKMNPLQAAKADARFSDSQFGSRKEYFANVLNPYHYDKKHYYDRPYLMTSPAFENVPIFGPTLAGTVGKLVKPQIKMHKDYWNEDGSVKTSNQIKGEELIANIDQQRLVSQGVANVMNKNAKTTVNEVYKNKFTTNIKELTESAKQKAFELIKKVEEGDRKLADKIRSINNSNLAYEMPQYENNINTEKAMLNATEPYAHAIDIRRNKNRVDDSAYWKYVEEDAKRIENSKSENLHKMYAEEYMDLVKRKGKRIDRIGEVVGDSMDSAYFSTVRPFQPKQDYLSNQVPISHHTGVQEVGGSVMVQAPTGYGVYGSEESVGGKYKEESLKMLQDQSGAILGRKKDFKKIIDFDKGYDLSNQNMVYRTGSGKYSIVNTGQEGDPLTKVNLNKKSPQSFIGSSKHHSITDNYLITDTNVQNEKEEYIQKPNGFITTIQNQVANASNVAGIYGFGFSTLTGDPREGTTVIDTPGYSRSFNKMFWDQEVGGIGGDVSEIFRRLVQKRKAFGVEYYNPIRNTMPDWLPGEGAFIDFQHGDPYAKIARGEERLPGHGYERAYGIDINNYRVGSSAMGKSKEELIAKFLEKDDITEEWQQDIVRKGTRIHEKVEEYMVRNHVAIDTERKIYDAQNDVIGYYDAKIHDTTSKTGERIVDIKTINSKGFDKVVQTGRAKEEHIKQVNWYLHHDNKDSKGGILYVDRENPTRMHMVSFNYSKKLYEESMTNVREARAEVQQAIASGQISRAERYRPIDKLRILADVAPYSQEYNDMLKYVRSIDLTEEQKKEVNYIEDLVGQQRKQLRTYEYRFTTSDVVSKKVKIERQLDDDKFMTDGYDDPIKLAGVELPSKSGDEERHRKAMEFINKNIKGKVEIKVAKDKHVRTNKDSLHTMNAVVYANGMNINRELIKRGLADEKENDYSAAGVHARFSKFQRGFGRAWETIAHQNTMFNNKVLRVRSAKEDYEREQIYGRDFKDWKHPIKDFFVPMIWGVMADESATDRVVGTVGGALIGSFLGASRSKKARVIGAAIGATTGGVTGTSLAMGALIGSMFGTKGSRFGKLLGAATGVATVAGFKAYKVGYQVATGEKWTPKEKRRENEVIDYLDKLEFVKNRRLYEVYAQKALKEDGIDVKKMIQESEEKGNKNKAWSKKIEKIKREQKKSGKFNTREYEKAGLKFDKNDKKHHSKRKDKANEAGKQDLERRKSAIRKEEEKLRAARKSLMDKNKKYIEENNLNVKSEDEYSKEEEIKETIKKQKKKIKKKKKSLKKATKKYMEDSKNRKQTALERTVNQRIDKAKNAKEITMTSPNAMKAIEYYNKAEATMYGYDQGENISDFVAALPKKDKKYFNEFLKAGEKERKEIMKIAPKYMKRALQASYGMKVDEKEDLVEYFNNHYLPDENWDGWQEGYDFDAIRTKVISREGFNLASHNIWEDNKIKADMYGATDVPNMDYRTGDIQKVKETLRNVLGEAGYQDLDITVSHGQSAPSINLDLYEDRRQEFENKIRERMRA